MMIAPMPGAILANDADAISVIETLYRPEPDFQRWAHDALMAAASTVAHPTALVSVIIAHGDDCADAAAIAIATNDAAMDQLASALDQDLARLGRDGFRRTFYLGYPVTS